MSDVFISYARSTAKQAQAVVGALRALGYSVWIDDELPAHRAYTDVLEERLRSAKAVVVIWSAEAAKSHWVRAEANTALEAGTLVQLTVDGVMPPMPFNQIQCADMAGWSGDLAASGWRKVVGSIGDLVGVSSIAAPTAIPAPPPLPSIPSIAVLPFTNLSGDPEQDYFADGMVVEIVAALSRIRAIFVIASGSSLSLKGKGLSPEEAARQLGVRFVLEGSVRKAGDRVRIAVQLIDAAQGAQIWTNRFDDTMEDVFALQDQVALSVAGRIEPTVLQAEIRRAAERPTENMGSYDLYLRSIALSLTYRKAETFQALELYNRAIALDPNFASALIGAATCHYLIDSFGWSDDREGNSRQSLELTQRALKAAPDDAAVLASAAGPILRFKEDLAGASALVERAIALNPGSSRAWLFGGMMQLRGGDLDLAVENFETSMRLDPRGPMRAAQLTLLAQARFQQRRFSEAIVLLKEVVEQTEPPNAYAYLAASYGHLGQLPEAREALARFHALTDQPFEAYALGISNNPAPRQLFLDGIALAEGKSGTDVAFGTGQP